jgi:hypothetical protein
VSTVPPEIPGIGSTTQKLRVSPGFDPIKAGVGPEEYFVLSRVDGSSTLRDVLLTTGLPVERAISIVIKLRTVGALLLPGEGVPEVRPGASGSGPVSRIAAATSTPTITKTTPVPIVRSVTPTIPGTMPATGTGAGPAIPRTATPPPASGRGTGSLPPLGRTAPAAPVADPTATTAELALTAPTPEERAALAEDVELDDAERRRILALARRVAAGDNWALLGLPTGADNQALKRAYFRLSKDIHPDRYYGKRLGSFGPRTATVFEAVSRAYATLSGRERGRGAAPASNAQATTPDAPQTPQEYAAELFDRACGLEVSGEIEGAMRLFAAAVRVDPQPRYLRRATSCALSAAQPKTALEYAKKAQAASPTDPSSARLLAAAFRAAGKLVDAEEVLIMAMALKSENDTLAAELRYDLAEVRRLLAT